MQWYFCFFVVSGFCSIMYEIVWLRLAMASFGVTTAMVSLVLSAFMGGLGLGSWGGGALVRKLPGRTSPLRFYALAELFIGLSAIAVPYQLAIGRKLVLSAVHDMSSTGYYLPAGIWLAITLVPWCVCMGATFPFAMAAIRNEENPKSARSFSYLYLANVLGATAGVTIPLFLIELFGFQRTLLVGVCFNLLLAISALLLSIVRKPSPGEAPSTPPAAPHTSSAGTLSESALLWLLFGTGFTSMGAEVVWVRLYTPSLSTVVYAFAIILGLYLIATDIGSWYYRRSRRGGEILESGVLWAALGASVVLAFLAADPRLPLPGIVRVALGIMPFSLLVGFATPGILDRYSGGDPDRAGKAYAINIVGCVLGPVVAGFLFLPALGERLSLCAFAVPWFIAGFTYLPRLVSSSAKGIASRGGLACCILTLGSAAAAFSAKGFEEQYSPREVRRDNTATIVATGATRADKRLLVNGVGITNLTPITKMMVHLPNAFLPHPPRKGLVICFGMGTTHLSMLSWGIPSTAVELVPSVPELVSFFHPNAEQSMKSPLSRVVIDDGRSYLERSSDQYDVITIDPPPPVEAAGSSLLYSKEFYATVSRHLTNEGILQQWLPKGDSTVVASVARALHESFPYVRAFGSIEGWGIHFLVSKSPIPPLTASELAKKLPAAAATDLLEWGPASTAEVQFESVIKHEMPVASLMEQVPDVPALQDDRPMNEYFILRRLREPDFWQVARSRLLGN
jgi:predicted membrane-bound spermidine synthase